MIYYLGYYNCSQIADERRKVAPPAINKMGYIISVLSECIDDEAVVVSLAETTLNKRVRGSVTPLEKNISLKTFDTIHGKSRSIRGFGHILTKTQATRFLMKSVKPEDTLLVYHSLSLMKLVEKIKKAKKCRVILEVEEIYSDVKEDSDNRKKELEYFQIADKLIVITELLNKEINPGNKPTIISHGTYKTNPIYSEKINDKKIHVVYSGTFDPIKGGAYMAIDAAEFLDERYVLHILGKGSDPITSVIKEKIRKVSEKTTCKIVFDGYKTGKDFDSFIQSCHIGLSTQQPEGMFNASSFPSKILMYMSNGLPVVSARIPAVEGSAVGKFVHYYDVPTAYEIARAIKSVELTNDRNACVKLDELNSLFTAELANLLS